MLVHSAENKTVEQHSRSATVLPCENRRGGTESEAASSRELRSPFAPFDALGTGRTAS